MSWRFLFLFLVLAAASAVFGGIELGDWLIEHAPESISQAASANSKNDRDIVLDANGKPFRAQPPQPRIDGTLGVPREMAPVEWTITAVTAMQVARTAKARPTERLRMSDAKCSSTVSRFGPGNCQTRKSFSWVGLMRQESQWKFRQAMLRVNGILSEET